MKQRELAAAGKRLTEYVEGFASVFGRSERRHWCKVYMSGLIVNGERKSVEPIATRVDGGNIQALQQFVNQSPWDSDALTTELRRDMLRRFRMKAAIYVLDDTSLPKKGDASVGVAHQYCGALGKLAQGRGKKYLPPLTEIRRWLNALMSIVVCAECGARATWRPAITGNSS